MSAALAVQMQGLGLLRVSFRNFQLFQAGNCEGLSPSFNFHFPQISQICAYIPPLEIRGSHLSPNNLQPCHRGYVTKAQLGGKGAHGLGESIGGKVPIVLAHHPNIRMPQQFRYKGQGHPLIH